MPFQMHERLMNRAQYARQQMLMGDFAGCVSTCEFSEAIGIDPTIAELWYNHGLACHYMARPAEAVRDFERAVELSKNETSEN